MLNYIWAGMILLGVIYGVCTGQMSALTGGALDSAREAVSLCITMAGVMALWMGLMEIAQESGMIAKMTKGIRPFLKFMFPRLPEDHPAGEYITTNLIANVLGLGWACTPAGLKAMEQLAELEKQRAGQGTEKGRQGSEDRRYGAEATAASNEMCTFLILNISSLQLIPVNMIAYRSQYGSANPAVIMLRRWWLHCSVQSLPSFTVNGRTGEDHDERIDTHVRYYDSHGDFLDRWVMG